MLNEKDLRSTTARELVRIAGNIGIVGRWDMKKDDLINAILRSEERRQAKEKKQAVKKKCDDSVRRASDGFKTRIKELKIGDSVAFRRLATYDDGHYSKMETGVVNEIYTDPDGAEMVLIETRNGCKYRIKKDGILWIGYTLGRGLKWPSFIFKELKSSPVPYDPSSDYIVGKRVLE